ncbi:BMC domain-containing protein [Anaerotruncus rubiinfantis]|uniref:BMC domain-containing protein n=1 Tax=Anaerotruncus rubiinfantis TaxID=1720200 RepID=UPI00082CD1EE|nr:BMC domain-containing protein [Anaerotruncus rubiinfantis]
MKYALIQRPSPATISMLKRKTADAGIKAELGGRMVEAVGLCQGSVLEVLVASDVAEKAAGVTAGEVNGNCPQHITCLAILGDTEAVHAAMEAVKAATATI